MQSILNLLIKYNHWFLFTLLEGISIVLLLFFNNYHSAVFFTSANGIAGNIYSMITDVEGYFNLKDENMRLVEHNRLLSEELQAMGKELSAYKDSTMLAGNGFVAANRGNFTFGTAKVINGSLNRVNNFITIDKGSSDGVTTEMGVFNEQGVVGIVRQTSENFAIVLPLLNSKSMISCRVKGSNSFCTLKWDGTELQHSYLIDLPRYALFEQGDTVVTSGFSSIFPAGIPVGEIQNLEDSDDGMFYRAKVKLYVNFSSIDNLFIVGHKKKNEQEILEESMNKEK
ncbi:MAG: rod shape-determining protein MreC [Bacteroidaceae bacterium]|nr:rod shape-determining protein MreC [Bacteroidaceae bacterium]